MAVSMNRFFPALAVSKKGLPWFFQNIKTFNERALEAP
jgi:hypothetical protein